ncbi:MAG TPA: Ig-like domain-containing protein [Vicinamibacterales bacterium]|nr:Ig-like domain-containing protein [Vicinamibacterales bacterium]
MQGRRQKAKGKMGAAVIAALVLFAACGGPKLGPTRIVLNSDKPRPTIDVVDVPAAQLSALQGTESREAWTAVLKVSVGPDQPATIGAYQIDNGGIVFTPMFPLDPGRQYHVTFTPPGGAPLSSIVSLPARNMTPTTTITQVYPTAEVVPENQLRLYIHFSAPMGTKGGLSYVHLFTEDGAEVADPFLPLDAEFFNDDRTRYTVFFDPGRQKRGIAPISQMGRSLNEGRTYTLVIDADWRDGNGLPLAQQFKRTFKAGPPDEKPLDPKTWKFESPAAGSRAPLTVAFPEPLDHGLLLRALGVLSPAGKPLPGQVAIGAQELTWSFTPQSPWTPGTYNIVAFAMLEDLAGNRIGRAFEVDRFDRADKSSEPDKTLIPVTIK